MLQNQIDNSFLKVLICWCQFSPHTTFRYHHIRPCLGHLRQYLYLSEVRLYTGNPANKSSIFIKPSIKLLRMFKNSAGHQHKYLVFKQLLSLTEIKDYISVQEWRAEMELNEMKWSLLGHKNKSYPNWIRTPDPVHWNLSWETTAMRDHLSWRTTSFYQKLLHSSVYELVTKDHLSWETIFLWPMGWSFKTGSTVIWSWISYRSANKLP